MYFDNINEHTFVGLAYHELSKEGFGLPSIRELRASSEDELFNAPIVKEATKKVKEFAAKKGLVCYKPATPKEKELLINNIIRKRKVIATKEELQLINDNVEIINMNGCYIVKCKTLLSVDQQVILGFIALVVGISVGFNVGTIINGILGIAPGNRYLGIGFNKLHQSNKLWKQSKLFGFSRYGNNLASRAIRMEDTAYGYIKMGKALISKAKIKTLTSGITAIAISIIGTLFSKFLEKRFSKINADKKLSLFVSWACFKNPKNGELILKKFCNAFIGPQPKYSTMKSIETLVSDETDAVNIKKKSTESWIDDFDIQLN